MTNILVRKNPPDDPNAPDPGVEVRQRIGMSDAGDKINTWMKDATKPPAKDFFDDLFDELDGADETKHGFFIEALNPATGTDDAWPLSKSGSDYEFEIQNDYKKLKVKCHADKDPGAGVEKMNIGIPEKRGDLVAGGYINTILSDLTALINAGEQTKAKQYLLAVIFLNRCQ